MSLLLNTYLQGHGHPLIWGHGMMGNMALENHTGWFHPTDAGQLRRIRYDACGHGHSASHPQHDWQWPTLGKDMLTVANQYADNAKFALGGQSMGCASALHAAIMAPDRVSHLILALPPNAWDRRPAQVARYRKMLALLDTHGMPALLRLLRQFPPLPRWLHQLRPEQSAASIEAIGSFQAQQLSRIIRGAMHSDLPEPAVLATLTIPTLILAWHDDPTHPLETAEALAGTLPNAHLNIASSVEELSVWPALIDRFIMAGNL